MKQETSFEKSDQFADVPGAVAKMSELVLEWATTGRLRPPRKPLTAENKIGPPVS